MANFYSDTQTKPPRAMREAILDAPVGDEQSDDDPTTRALCERVADLLGKETAVLLPTGTMCNEIAIAVRCRPGDELICEADAHILHYEGGAPAALAGVMCRPLPGHRGALDPDQVRAAIRSGGRHTPATRLVCVEQTANLAGCAVWPIERLAAVAETAKAKGLATHMDGARLLNAAVASGRPAAEHARGYDSVWIDLTKGLGCPVGAVLAGDHAFIDAAWRLKHRWGGAMRQSGILAAMGLWALDHHVDRLAEDHALACGIAGRLAALPVAGAVLPVETNMVIVDLAAGAPDAAATAGLLAVAGVRVTVFGPRRLRIVTHHDVGPADAEKLLAALTEIPVDGA